MNQQQILQTQYHKITEYQAHIEQLQSHIEQLQSQLESYNQQMSYHNSMINAFNTVTQNPEYFIQLMAASMCNPIEIDDIHYNNTI
jgi:cell division septum initiation protein DivIVA